MCFAQTCALERRCVQTGRAAALMHKAHNTYWDRTSELMQGLGTIPLDSNLRNATLWRRAPFGTRVIAKDTPCLGLSLGMKVPQLVLHENLRARAPKCREGYLVPPDFPLPISPADGSSRRSGQ